jgi:hypothetical protein
LVGAQSFFEFLKKEPDELGRTFFAGGTLTDQDTSSTLSETDNLPARTSIAIYLPEPALHCKSNACQAALKKDIC